MQQTSAHNINKQTFFRKKKNCLAEKFFQTTSTISTPPMASTNTHLNSYGLQWTPMDSNGLQWAPMVRATQLKICSPKSPLPMASYGLQWSQRYIINTIPDRCGRLGLAQKARLNLAVCAHGRVLAWVVLVQ